MQAPGLERGYETMPYQSIVVALAGEADEHSVVHEAVRLASAMDARLTVLHVNSPAAGKLPMMMEAEKLVAESDIQKIFVDLGYLDEASRIKVEVRESASLAKEIASATEQADLLVIGHRQKNRFLAALADAADKHLCDLVACPVLIVPRVPADETDSET